MINDLQALTAQLKHRGEPAIFNVAKDGNTTKMRLSGVIINSDPFGLGGVAADDVIDALNSVDSENVVIELTSPGGSVIAGMAIKHAIKKCKARVHIDVVGIAASAATFLLAAADSRGISRGSKVMIHRAWVYAEGNEEDLSKTVELLKQTDKDIAAMYCELTGKSEDEVYELMRAETYFSAEAAVKHGFIDSIIEYEQKAEQVQDVLAQEDLQSVNEERNATKEKAQRRLRLRERQL